MSPCAICGPEDEGIERGLYTAEQAAARNRWERINARRERREPEIVGHEACRRCPDCGCSRAAAT
jgi:hypothetical protein